MTQREVFEAWAKSQNLDPDHKEKDAWGRDVYSPHIHSMWCGWQAAQAQATAPMRDVHAEVVASHIQNIRCVKPLECPKCHALWLFWPKEQSGFATDTLSVKSATHCNYCECARADQLVPLDRVQAAQAQAATFNDVPQLQVAYIKGLDAGFEPPFTPLSLQPAHDAATIDLLNDKVMRQQDVMRLALEAHQAFVDCDSGDSDDGMGMMIAYADALEMAKSAIAALEKEIG